MVGELYPGGNADHREHLLHPVCRVVAPIFRKLLEWLRDRVQIKIGGLSPERFLNLCAGSGMVLRGLRKTPDGYQCWMILPEYRE